MHSTDFHFTVLTRMTIIRAHTTDKASDVSTLLLRPNNERINENSAQRDANTARWL